MTTKTHIWRIPPTAALILLGALAATPTFADNPRTEAVDIPMYYPNLFLSAKCKPDPIPTTAPGWTIIGPGRIQLEGTSFVIKAVYVSKDDIVTVKFRLDGPAWVATERDYVSLGSAKAAAEHFAKEMREMGLGP